MTDPAPKGLTPESRYSLLRAFTLERRAQLIEDAMASSVNVKQIYSVHYELADSAYLEGYEDGAAAELEACCGWLKANTPDHMTVEFLRDARCPKPLSPRQKALAQLALACAEAQKAPVGTVSAKPFTDLHILLCELLPND